MTETQEFPKQPEKMPIWLVAVRERARFASALMEAAMGHAHDGETERKTSPFAASMTAGAYIEMFFGAACVFTANLTSPEEKVEERVIEMVRTRFAAMRSLALKKTIMGAPGAPGHA